MRLLFFCILFFTCCCSAIVQTASAEMPTAQLPSKQAHALALKALGHQAPAPQEPEPPAPQEPPSQDGDKDPLKSEIEHTFSSAIKDKKGNKKDDTKGEAKEDKKIKPIVLIKKTVVNAEQLQKIISSLPEKEKKIISAIKAQITTWPKEVFDEISSYREFVIGARKIAKQKYAFLSQEARRALETEKQLKEKLSPSTIKTLENLEVKVNS